MGRAPGPSIRGLRAPSQALAEDPGATLAPCPPMVGARPCHLTRPRVLLTEPEDPDKQQCTEIKTRLSTIRTSLPRATRAVGLGHIAVNRAREASLGARGPVQCSPTTTTTRQPVVTHPVVSTSMVWGPPQSACPRLL